MNNSIYNFIFLNDKVDRHSATPYTQTQVINLTHASNISLANLISTTTIINLSIFTLYLFIFNEKSNETTIENN